MFLWKRLYNNIVVIYVDSNKLKGLYIVHRGIHNDKIIENTIPAFSLALNKNLPIELDVRILKDGNLVVYHDSNLKRLIGIDRKLSSYTYQELKNLVFPNTKLHIPLFKDVLTLVNGKVLLIIEIKSNDIFLYQEYCRKITSILDEYTGDFVVKSFDIRIVNWFLNNTNYVTGLLLADLKNSLVEFFKNYKMIRSIFKPDFLSVDYHLIDKKIIQKFRKNKPVLVWTIKSMSVLNSVKDKADSFIIEDI